ncbi:lipin Ned1 [Coniosporium tulheliwenetii]|uniref:Lipin Ned1 n=1 Tax=Coniosporium tulheliwenetii TaxID=3383036 RepID=A0ACC2ZLJ3_9PEZI|nr:lipin Ned1 [Cladosporium sp. JES 115]
MLSFHVRFGKFSLLRPYEKKVEFRVNDEKKDHAMKLGEGGEAFFVFETSESIPEDMQTSPLVSPAASPEARPVEAITPNSELPEPEALDLASTSPMARRRVPRSETEGVPQLERRAKSDLGEQPPRPSSPNDAERPKSGDWSGQIPDVPIRPATLAHANTEVSLPLAKQAFVRALREQTAPPQLNGGFAPRPRARRDRSTSPPPISTSEAVTRAISLSKKLWTSNIPTQVTDKGDLMLDMTGYKSSEEELLRAEAIARQILSEELEGNYDIGALIGVDEKGNVWIYSSEEAKEEAARRASLHGMNGEAMKSTDAVSDPGYASDDNRSEASDTTTIHMQRDSKGAVGLPTPPKSPDASAAAGDPNRNYAKTLRLTSDQLKALNLKPGQNSMSFSVNRATCHACMYLWRHDVPIVISDIDGTITKSDALGHVLNMIGRDWTHLGVAKLYTDIVANGYNIFYLTSRSVGQADTTRAYLNGVVQDGYRLPKGPVIMSPDRTIAALRREIYLRKPEVFKMSCLRDIMNLFSGSKTANTPFYAGFGNRLTDALSYRSVNIPKTRIFTINSNAEVTLALESLNHYKTGYTSMREIVDHVFPPTSLLLAAGEEFTDFNYWREKPLEIDEFSDSEDDDDQDDEARRRMLRAGRESIDEEGAGLGESILESIEGDDAPQGREEEDDADEEEGDDYDDDDITPGMDMDLPSPINERRRIFPDLSQRVDALDLSSGTTPPKRSEDVREDLKDLAHALNTPESAEKLKARS